MKKLILIASLFAMSNIANCQKNSMINTKDLSPLSFGAMPVVFANDKGPGLGLELNTRYAVTKDFGIGVFGRMKSIFQEDNSSYNEYGPTGSSVESINVFALGASADYNLFRSIVLQFRGGYETEANLDQNRMDSRYIIGGGLVINFSKSQSHKIGHSLRFAVDFESDRHLGITVPTLDFSDFPRSQSAGEKDAVINAFSFQVGWNFQFHSIKRKR